MHLHLTAKLAGSEMIARVDDVVIGAVQTIPTVPFFLRLTFTVVLAVRRVRSRPC